MKTIINIKADKEIKEKAQPRMTPELESYLGIIERDIKNKKNISKYFSSAKEAIDYLHS